MESDGNCFICGANLIFGLDSVTLDGLTNWKIAMEVKMFSSLKVPFSIIICKDCREIWEIVTERLVEVFGHY